MVEGAIAKFRKENALLSPALRHGQQDQGRGRHRRRGKDAGAPIALKAYVRFQLGEGIEKKESDFAAEVAAAAGTAEAPSRSPDIAKLGRVARAD